MLHRQKSMENEAHHELIFPFIACNNTKHRRHGPQTVVTQFFRDNNKDKLSLFCNSCHKEYEKKFPNNPVVDIEDYIEKFIEKTKFTNIELPIPPNQLTQTYEIKDQSVASFRKKMEKEIQVLTQTFEEMAQEITKLLFEKRDQLLKSFSNMIDVFSGSYEMLGSKYEQMFTWNDQVKTLKELKESEIKSQLVKIKTVDTYTNFIELLNSCDQILTDLSRAPQKIEELCAFSESLQMLTHMMPPSPEQRKMMKENVLSTVKSSIREVFAKISFGKNKVTQKVTTGLLEYFEADKSALAKNLAQKIEYTRNVMLLEPPPLEPAKNIIPVPSEILSWEEKILTDPGEPDLYKFDDTIETPFDDGENNDGDNDVVQSVTINIMDDLDQLNNPLITHLEINSSEMTDDLAIAVAKMLMDIKCLSSLSLDFSEGNNVITDVGSLALIKSMKKHKKLKGVLLDFSEGKNAVTNQTIVQLANMLGDLESLDMLFINFCCGMNNITEEGLLILADSLQKLTLLNNLRINLCGGKNIVSDKAAIAISQSVGNMRNLNYLLLKFCCGSNHVTEKGHLAMSNALKRLDNLVSLTVATSGEGANDQSAEYMSQAFKKMWNLKALNFGFYENNLTDKGAEYIAHGISKMKSLQSMRINICGGAKKLTDLGMKYLSEALGTLPELSAITLSFNENNIGDDGIIEVSKNLAQLENLNTIALNFQGSHIGDKGACALAEFIKSSTKLSSVAMLFSALNSKITDAGAKEVIAAIHQLAVLEFLTIDFSDNVVSDESLRLMALALKDIDTLTSLTLCFDGNKITEGGVNSLCTTVASLKNLRTITLFFANNPINKSIWEEISVMMRKALPTTNISITWDHNYR